ncbi:hypothetical protein RDABS01_025438 [Bienertia sinuspersici]
MVVGHLLLSLLGWKLQKELHVMG